MNKVILLGNLTRDPELKTTPAGKSVASCSLATNKTFKDANGEKKSLVNFHNLVVWGKQAEVFNQYLKKGSKIALVGEINTSNYEKDGIKRYRTDIVVGEFEFLTPKQTTDQTAQPAPANDYSQQEITNFEPSSDVKIENIPF